MIKIGNDKCLKGLTRPETSDCGRGTAAHDGQSHLPNYYSKLLAGPLEMSTTISVRALRVVS